MSEKKFVAYYRVSTLTQGKSGLGLDGQRTTVENTVGRESLEKEFIEVESGRNSSRPKLLEAIEYCKENGCCLVVAKLDRLGRKAKHLFVIKESGIDLRVCNMPKLDTLTFGIYATMAQHEAEEISERTKAALKEAKRRGRKLGKPENLDKKARQKGVAARKEAARKNPKNQKAYKIARDARESGLSLRKIADRLNDYFGEGSIKGGKFHASTVKHLLEMYE